jgi:hypothetical protein
MVEMLEELILVDLGVLKLHGSPLRNALLILELN